MVCILVYVCLSVTGSEGRACDKVIDSQFLERHPVRRGEGGACINSRDRCSSIGQHSNTALQQ